MPEKMHSGMARTTHSETDILGGSEVPNCQLLSSLELSHQSLSNVAVDGKFRSCSQMCSANFANTCLRAHVCKPDSECAEIVYFWRRGHVFGEVGLVSHCDTNDRWLGTLDPAAMPRETVSATAFLSPAQSSQA